MKILIICGGIIIEVISIFKTLEISNHSFNYAILEVSKKGYKVDFKISNAFFKEELKRRKNANIFIKIWRYIVLFIPIINIILTLIDNKILKNKYLSNKNITNSYIPLTIDEKKVINNSNRIYQKVGYTTYIKDEVLVRKRVKKI